MEEKSHLPARELSKNTSEPFIKIYADGKFLHDYQLLLDGKYIGKTLGYHVITPFQTGDMVVLVNRGWVAKADKDRIDKTENDTRIEGYIKKTINPPWFFPQNIPEKNMWLWADAGQIAEYIEKHSDRKIEQIIIQQTNVLSDIPITAKGEIKLRNDHLQYAITWYSLALVVLLMFLIYIRKK